MKNKLAIAAVVAVVLVGGFYAFNSYIYNEKQGTGEPDRVTLEGLVVCLPHKGDGPHTKECATGLMTPDGTHYALDLMLMSQEAPQIHVSDRIRASGVITPPEADTKYDIEGSFGVTDSLEVTSSHYAQ